MTSSAQEPSLYEGEKLETINDSPALTYFVPGNDPLKPLIVFVPGAFHLGRISYGGHKGGNASDFMAHWFREAGYSFLAVSYPLESTPTIMPATRPDFTVREWGAQVAEATKQTIEGKGLSNRNVILLFWSMAGKILHPYSLEARTRDINIKLAVSLVATPAVRGIRDFQLNPIASKAGYSYSSSYQSYFLAQVHEQNVINGGKEIIPDDIFVNEYMGYYPVTMSGFGWKYTKDEGKMVEDSNAGFEVSDVLPPAELPYMGAIIGDSPLDFRHTVADQATWGYLMTYQLMAAVSNLIPPKQNPNDAPWLWQNSEKAKKIMAITRETPSKLCVVMEGNHHLFIGEKGAKGTVDLVKTLQERVEDFKTAISAELTV